MANCKKKTREYLRLDSVYGKLGAKVHADHQYYVKDLIKNFCSNCDDKTCKRLIKRRPVRR